MRRAEREPADGGWQRQDCSLPCELSKTLEAKNRRLETFDGIVGVLDFAVNALAVRTV